MGQVMKMWERIQRFYPPWLELIAPFLLVFVWAYSASHYGALPDMMPTHFGMSGAADDWSPKGFWSVYVPLVIGTVVWLSMVLMNYYLIIKPEDPGKYVNLTKQQKVKLGPAGLENIRTITARGMMAVNLTVAALISTLQYGSVNTALGLQNGLGWSAHIFGAALLIECIWMSWKTISATFTPTKSR